MLFLVGILVIAFFVLKDILLSILFGMLFAYLFYPVYKKLNRKLHKPNLSSVIILILFILILVIPVLIILPALAQQALHAYSFMQTLDLGGSLSKLLPQFLSSEMARVLNIQINNLVSQFFSQVLNQASNIITAIPNLILQFAVMFFTFYFATRDGDKIVRYLESISPLSGKTHQKFIYEFKHITDAIVYGQGLIGVVQGLAVGLILFLLGVSNYLILTLIATLFSIIPILGAGMVWFPVAIFMLFTGSPIKGIILLIYGFFFVSIIDNVLRPYFLSKGSALPISVALIGTIGGLYAFGVIGLIFGPLVLAYAIILLDFYRKGKFREIFRS